MIQDLRLAFRMMAHAKGWTIVVVLSLALGIGANTALFSAVNGMLLKTLDVADPGSLVRLRYAGRNDMVTSSSDYGRSALDARGREVRTTFSYPMFKQLVASNETMSDLFACAQFGRPNVTVDGQSDVATGFISTGNYYTMLGVKAHLGRVLLPSDDRDDAPAAAVVSYRYWQSRFGGNPAVVGKQVQINGLPATIVGVLPAGFFGVQTTNTAPPDISVPLALDTRFSVATVDPDGPPRLADPVYWWLQVMGRLKPGVTTAQVQANLGDVFRQTARAGFDEFAARQTEEERSTQDMQSRKEVPDLIVDSGSRGIYQAGAGDRTSLMILTIVVALVLLIVCANVANLLLSRATARHKEISLRLSLGATRLRLVRQLLTESLLLAAIGGSLGILIGYWGQTLLPGAEGRATPIDWRVMAFVAALTTVTGVVFGIAPAFRATGVDLNSALKESGRSVVASRSLLTRMLLVTQVAVSLVLLIAAALFLRTLTNLRNVDVGFNPKNLVLFRVNPALNRYDPPRIRAFYADLLNRLPAAPGVQGSALSSPALLAGSVNSSAFYLQGRSYDGAQRRPDTINRVVVSPSFFDVMGMPILVGRGLNDRDQPESPKVAVINEAAVRKYFPDGSPIGRRFGPSAERSADVEVVGVLKDAKYNSLRDEAPPTMYVPYTQTMTTGATFEVRTAGPPLSAVAAIREIVRQIDPNVPLIDISTQEEQIERRFADTKVFAQACTMFGGLALLLASIGLFGLMSYSVARRTNEIGIRMALGARSLDVLRMVMRESLALVALGVAIGLVAALAAGRFVASLLFGLAPTDVVAMLAATGLMVTVAVIAAFLPARRASRVDPMTALRCE